VSTRLSRGQCIAVVEDASGSIARMRGEDERKFPQNGARHGLLGWLH
jgi:hypothetical protein